MLIFYPFDITYKIKNDHAIIYLYGKTADNSRVCVTYTKFQPYFYAQTDASPIDIKKIRVPYAQGTAEIVDIQQVEKNFTGKSVRLLKIFTKLPQHVPIIKKELERSRTTCYEADILFTRRFLIDHRLTPLSAVQATGSFTNERSKVPVFEATELVSTETQRQPESRILAVDIETYNPGKGMNMEKYPIIMIAFYGLENSQPFKKVLTWKKFPVTNDYTEFVQGEFEMLQRFKEIIDEYKPDILTGYYSDGFDLPYIITRARKYQLQLDISLDYTVLDNDKRDIKEIKINGIVHLDIFQFVKHVIGRSLKTGSFKLDDVAAEILGERKHVVDMDALASVWDSQSDALAAYAEYNLQDAKITFDLCKKLLPNIEELAKIIGLPLFDVSRMSFSRLVESYIMTQTSVHNELIPNKPDDSSMANHRAKTYVGGFVYQPTPGLYENVAVFDFRSLYPTIIISHNISPSSLRCGCCNDVIAETKDWFCKKKKGFLPLVLEDIVTRRARIKELMKAGSNLMLESRSNALKLLANSFYGYLGFAPARWYSFESAENVTALGRQYIQQVIAAAQSSNFSVIYSDTDSIFMRLGEKSTADARSFVEKINATLPGVMELDYEGFYPAALFVSAKASSAGAKKKYAMLNDQGKLKIRGFETVRRNWSVVAKQMQLRVLEIILKEKDTKKAVAYTKELIRSIREHKIPVEQMLISTQLTRPIESYDSIGPHVAVARRIVQRGTPVPPGTIIHFVVAEGSGVVRDRAFAPDELGQRKYDADYYINNQILPSVDRILEVFGVDIKNESALHQQKSLSAFFG